MPSLSFLTPFLPAESQIRNIDPFTALFSVGFKRLVCVSLKEGARVLIALHMCVSVTSFILMLMQGETSHSLLQPILQRFLYFF